MPKNEYKRDENVEMNVRNNRKDKIKKWAHLKIGIASMGDQLRETFFLSYRIYGIDTPTWCIVFV